MLIDASQTSLLPQSPAPALADDEAAPASAFAQFLAMFLPVVPPAIMAPAPEAEGSVSTLAAQAPLAAAPTIDPSALLARDVAQLVPFDKQAIGNGINVPSQPVALSELGTAGLSPTRVIDEVVAEPVMVAAANLASPEPPQQLIDNSAPPAVITSATALAPLVDSAVTATLQAEVTVNLLDEKAPDGTLADGADPLPPELTRRPFNDEAPIARDIPESASEAAAIQPVAQSPASASAWLPNKAVAAAETPAARLDLTIATARPEPAARQTDANAAANLQAAVEAPLTDASTDPKNLFTIPAAAQPAHTATIDSPSVAPVAEDDRQVTAFIGAEPAATPVQKPAPASGQIVQLERPEQAVAEPSPVTRRETIGAASIQESGSKSDGVAPMTPAEGDSAAQNYGTDNGAPPQHEQLASAPVRFDAPVAGNSDLRAAEPATPAWRPVVEHVARDMVEHLRVGKQEAVLQLDPPELGRIKIDLRLEDGKLHANIVTEGQESRGLIESHLGELQQALRSHQIEVVEMRVSQGQWNASGGLGQNFEQARQERQEGARGFAAGGVFDRDIDEARPPTARNAEGRLSMWA